MQIQEGEIKQDWSRFHNERLEWNEIQNRSDTGDSGGSSPLLLTPRAFVGWLNVSIHLSAFITEKWSDDLEQRGQYPVQKDDMIDRYERRWRRRRVSVLSFSPRLCLINSSPISLNHSTSSPDYTEVLLLHHGCLLCVSVSLRESRSAAALWLRCFQTPWSITSAAQEPYRKTIHNRLKTRPLP